MLNGQDQSRPIDSTISKRLSWSRLVGRRVVELVLFIALAIALTWPLTKRLSRDFPLGTEPSPSIVGFNIWTLWWNVDRIEHGYQDYWDAPIFHPVRDTFAFSEAQPLTGLIAAPILWISRSPILTYNLVLLSALVANGWTAYGLQRAIGLGRAAALAGGAMTEALPFVHHELGVLQLVPLAGVIATIWALVRFGQRPGLMRGAVLGVAAASTLMMCNYYVLALASVLICGGWWLVAPALRKRETWMGLALAFCVAMLLTGPVITAQLRASKNHDFAGQRTLEKITSLSLRLTNYMRTPWPARVPFPGVSKARDAECRGFWPGTVKLGLAVAGIALGLTSRRHRKWSAFCVTMFLVGFVLSLGPNLSMGSVQPYLWLRENVPGFSQIRSPFRFAMLPSLAVALLAPIVLDRIQFTVRRLKRLDRPVRARMLGILLVILSLMATADVWPQRQRLFTPPGHQSAWVQWIASQTPTNAVFAFLPFPRDRFDYGNTMYWMFRQMEHGRTLLNGYSGFFPKSFILLSQQMYFFPQQIDLRPLIAAGADYIVVARNDAGRQQIEDPRASGQRVRWVFSDEIEGVDIYKVVAPP